MKFKKTIALVAACFCAGSIFAQEVNSTLTVKMKKPNPSDKIFVFYRNKPSSMKIDSAAYDKGKYVLKIQVPFSQRAFVYVYPSNGGFMSTPRTKPGIPFYLETGNINMEILENNTDAVVKGTKMNNDLQDYADAAAPFKAETEKMEKEFNDANMKNDTVTMVNLQKAYADVAKKQNDAEKAFFYKHNDSQVSLDWLMRTVDIANNKSQAQAMFNSLSKDVRESEAGRAYACKLGQVQAIEVGVEAPDFTAATPEGKNVSLSSYRGKYVLVDFWASWCGPCRRENPNVVKAYAKYKSDKFDILGVSLDNSRDAWTQAVKKDGITWTQVSDLMGWQSLMVSKYAVRAIPANFLIDPSGKIIAKNLRGDDLENKLSEVFK